MIIVRLLSPEPVGWFCHHQLYSGIGADIVMESIALIDGFCKGSAKFTDTRPSRPPLCLGENLVHLLAGLLTARGLQIPHCALHVGVTEPLLHGPQINTRPKTSRRKRCAELEIGRA